MIIKQTLLFNTLRDVSRTVWRIYILILGYNQLKWREKLLTVKWTPVTSITLGPSLKRKKKNACDFFTLFACCMKHWGKVQSTLWNYKSHFECNEANCCITFLTTSYARVTKLEISCSRGNILPRRTWLSPSCTCSLSAPEIKKKLQTK